MFHQEKLDRIEAKCKEFLQFLIGEGITPETQHGTLYIVVSRELEAIPTLREDAENK